jgi:ubiquinone/menaquinone biosynthesis C-methylase UbiE
MARTYDVSQMKYGDNQKGFLDSPITLKEEVHYAANEQGCNHEGFLYGRIATFDAIRKIVHDNVDFSKGGIEVGAGALAWFYSAFVPKDIRWMQFEVNPMYARRNADRTKHRSGKMPEIYAASMYDLPLPDSSTGLIVGNSSWDSIMHFEAAAAESYRVLGKGGELVLFQDLRPAEPVILVNEAKARIAAGYDAKVPICFSEFYDNDKKKLATATGRPSQKRFKVERIICMDGTTKRCGEYLHDVIAAALEKNGFEVMTNENLRVRVTKKNDTIRKSLGSLDGILGKDDNTFMFHDGILYSGNDRNLDEDITVQDASMYVLKARKL